MSRTRTFALISVLLGAALALSAACGDDDDDGGDASPVGVASPTGGIDEEGLEIQLVAENVQFNDDTLEAPAGTEVSLTLDNRDTVQHSFSLFETEEAAEALFDGEEFAGPSFLTYQFTAPEQPGTYHFHCDVHPTQMTGDFVVE